MKKRPAKRTKKRDPIEGFKESQYIGGIDEHHTLKIQLIKNMIEKGEAKNLAAYVGIMEDVNTVADLKQRLRIK